MKKRQDQNELYFFFVDFNPIDTYNILDIY